MIIGLDAKRAAANLTGLGNYSRFIVDILATHHDKNSYRLFIPKKKKNRSFDKLLKYKNVDSQLPTSSTMKRFSSLWRSYFIKQDLLRDGVQLYHGLSNELPIGIHKTGIKSVVTIHDLIFLHYPQFYKSIDRRIYDFKFKYACRVADRVIAISECTKRDIMKFYGVPESKIDVIYQGCDTQYAEKPSDEKLQEVKQKYNLPEKYILNVGSIESRKNLLLAVKAMTQVDTDLHLVAVGKKTPYTNEIISYCERKGLTDRVHLIHDLPYADLPAVYRMAQAFVYPSRYEGFGIPIIEAMHCALPVIAATGSCLEEAGGPKSIYVDPDDVNGMAAAINRVAGDEILRTEMIAAGKEYLKRFEDGALANDLERVYRKCFDAPNAPILHLERSTKMYPAIPLAVSVSNNRK